MEKQTQTPQLPQNAVSKSVILIKDLRVGNLYVEKGSNFVKAILSTTFAEIESGYVVPNGIKLTNKWLKKLGFKKASEFDKFGGYLIETGKNDCKVRLIDFTYDFHVFGLQFEFVHEVQNWFYFLTGRELTVC